MIVLRELSGTSIGLLMLFYGFCATSALWSPVEVYSLYRAVEVLVVFASLLSAIHCTSGFEHAERLVLGFAALVSVLVLAQYGRLVQWGSFHNNHCPMIAAMILCYCIGEVGQATVLRRRRLLAYAVASGVILCVGTSASANVATVCGVCMAGIIRRTKIRMLLIWVMVVATLLVLTGYIDKIEGALMTILFPGKSEGQILTAHGRVQFWQDCWPAIMKRPLLGYGFGGAPRLLLGVRSAHNALMDIVIGTGIVGLGLFGLAVLVLLHEWTRIPDTTAGRVGCCCAFTTAFVGCMGTSFLGIDVNASLIAFFMFVGLYGFRVLQHDNQPRVLHAYGHSHRA